MNRFLRLFFTGMMISFLGSLPLGTLNVAVMQISVSDGVRAAIFFSMGTLLVEILYVRLSLIAMDWVRKQERLFRMLEWLTLLIVIALAVSSFYAALHPSEEKNVILNSSLPKFLLGLLMSAVNPVQIPFWFGWSTVLFTRGVLQPGNKFYNVYIVGIGIGTLIANFVFIYGGQLIAGAISRNHDILNYVIGGIFALTAIIQIYKMTRSKSPVDEIKHPEENLAEKQETFDELQR